MKLIFPVTLLFLSTMAAAENFDDTALGALPEHWIVGSTGRGMPKWAVEADADAPSKPNVLKQSGHGTFPWCVKKDAVITDGFVETKFKTISGKEDQAGGVIWRWQNGNNYYVARANAMENNVSLYYTERGRRHTIQYANASVSKNKWHVLRVEFHGNRIKVLLDGKMYIDARDHHITEGGAVGLWTKADSITAFDDFNYGSITQ